MTDALRKPTPLDDDTTRPDYYGGAADPFEVVKVWRDLGMGPAAHYATALKYLKRAGKKGDQEMKDLRKAEWYITTAVELGYEWPHRGEMEPIDIILAWACPPGISDAVLCILNNKPASASVALRAYIIRREAELAA